jgi:putative phage-type endonuclease
VKRLGVWQVETPEWHAARDSRIGGSEIGTVAGWNPWETRDDLLGRKLGLIPRREGNANTERGHYLEEAVATWLADKSSLTYDYDASQGTYVHPELDWMAFNPDRLTTDSELVEIKTASTRDGWGRQGTDAIPLTYQAQCHWGLHVLGLTICHVGVLFGDPFQFARYKVRYDPMAADYLIRQGEAFMADLATSDHRSAA